MDKAEADEYREDFRKAKAVLKERASKLDDICTRLGDDVDDDVLWLIKQVRQYVAFGEALQKPPFVPTFREDEEERE